MNETIWKPVPEFEGYEVSNQGQIARKYKNGNRKILKPWNPKETTWRNYQRIELYSKQYPKGKLFRVHRLIATVFIPNPEEKRFVHHIDLDETNNAVDNLMWVTQEEHDLIHRNNKTK